MDDLVALSAVGNPAATTISNSFVLRVNNIQIRATLLICTIIGSVSVTFGLSGGSLKHQKRAIFYSYTGQGHMENGLD